MTPQEEFYENYDAIIPKLCKPYWGFIATGAWALPSTTTSVCEIGMGTGNFSLAVRDRFPSVQIKGVEINPDLVQRAQKRMPYAHIEVGDAFVGELPSADYYISSLALHHLPTEKRSERLLYIAAKGKGLVNFDIALPQGKTKESAIQNVLDYAKESFSPQTLEIIADEMRQNDNPMEFAEQEHLFRNAGYNWNVLAYQFPFAVYHVQNTSQT